MKSGTLLHRFNSTWDDNPAGYAELRECWLNQRRANFICQYIERIYKKNSSRILEIGSGTGNLLFSLSKQFQDVTFVGAEPNANYVEYSNEKAKALKINNLKFICSLAENLSNECSDFTPDIILTNDCLHHIGDLAKAIHEIRVLSKSGTHWLAIEPNANNPYVFLKQATGKGEKNFYLNQFRKLASSAWKESRKGYLFIVPPFIKSPPKVLAELESRLEGNRLLSGGVYVELQAL